MATSRSSPPPLPFGCTFVRIVRYISKWETSLTPVEDSFQDLHDFPQHPPPAPAPGPALLDDTESSMLDTFFDTMGTSHFDTNDYMLDRSLIGKNDGDPVFSWADDLPPTFHGSTTSLSQHPAVSHNHLNVSYGGKSAAMQMPQETSPKTTPAEILAAASTLIRNGRSSNNHGFLGSSVLPVQHSGDRPHEMTNGPVSMGGQPLSPYPSVLPAAMQQIPRGFLQAKSKMVVESGETLLHDMYFGSASQVQPTFNHATKAPDIQWGSDVSFLEDGYIAPPNQETEEEVTKTLMHKMECFEPQESANTTRPPSPASIRRGGLVKAPGVDHNFDETSEESVDELGQGGHRPRKRRKSQHQDEESAAGVTITNNRRKKAKVATNGKDRQRRSTDGEFIQKRRKSQSREPKSNRENLTEQQKRSNHILSEQKRRNLIKQGFEDLCRLVPELRGGGFSKSAMLIQAADWLEDVIRGNELLKAQLAGLDRMRTA